MAEEAVAPSSIRRRSHNKLFDRSKEDGAKIVEVSSLGKPSISASNDSNWKTISAASFLTFLVLLALYFTSRLANGALRGFLSNVEPIDPSSSLNHILHPRDHIYRNATSQYHLWRVTSGLRRPDGVEKRVYLVNDEFALPTIEGRPGDIIVVDVENLLDEDLSLHWHGLRMEGANEMDGAVGLTQCPISPGANFTYRFQLDGTQHGTFWWHAHDQVQRADGLYGGFVIHKPAVAVDGYDHHEFAYDEERLLLVGDWYHRSAKDVMKWYMRAGSFGNEPVPDSLLINGAGSYNCSMAVNARPVLCFQTSAPGLTLDTTKTYRFRVVNVGSLAGFTVGLVGAEMKAITLDGAHEIESEPAESVGILYPGERTDVLVSWASSARRRLSSLRVELDNENFRYPNPALTDVQHFPVHDPGVVEVNAGQHTPATFTSVFPLTAANASSPDAFSALPDVGETLLLYATTKKLAKWHNHPYGFMNHTSWKPQQNPALPLLLLPRSSWDANQFVPFISSPSAKPTVVDLIINNRDDGSHPFHLHGHDFFVLSNCADGSYWGSYVPWDAPDGPPCGPYNVINPPKRDTVVIPRRGYAVLRFLADNPGIWMLHCHLLWHQAAGMAMGLHVGDADAESSVSSGWVKEDRKEQLMSSCGISESR